MAYDDSRFRGEPGFREEADFRAGGVPEDAPAVGGLQSQSIYAPGAYPVADYGAPGAESMPSSRRAAPSAAQLDEVFDDPEHGDPGRDRMAVHALWEMVLLLGGAALVYLLRGADPASLRGTGLKELLLFAAEVGLVTVGMGLSLRTYSVNLAVGPIAYASALYFAGNSNRGVAVAAGITALIAIGVGGAIALLVAGFHVPSWAASLGAALALMVWIEQHRAAQVVKGAYDPHKQALYWFVGFVGLAAIGGILGMFKPIRRAVGRFRPVSDPARRRGGAAAVLSILALAGSSLLAATAGVLIALAQRDVTPATNGVALTGVALGAALLGGTSAFGRRGGVLGTVLSVVLIVLLVRYAAVQKWNLSILTVGAFSIFAGLIVTRLIETFGRPRTAVEEVEEEEWTPTSVPLSSDSASWSASRTGGWTSQLPARATDEGWGAEERWGTR